MYPSSRYTQYTEGPINFDRWFRTDLKASEALEPPSWTSEMYARLRINYNTICWTHEPDVSCLATGINRVEPWWALISQSSQPVSISRRWRAPSTVSISSFLALSGSADVICASLIAIIKTEQKVEGLGKVRCILTTGSGSKRITTDWIKVKGNCLILILIGQVIKRANLMHYTFTCRYYIFVWMLTPTLLI